MSPRSTVLLPLYIYPLPGAWDPLFDAISSFPNVDFVIVINPHDGPGEGEYPDEDYSEAISRLNGASNVRTVGYVRIDYCRRDNTQVCKDIAKYDEWSKKSPEFAFHGIFFDETPNHHSDSIASYLKIISQEVRTRKGFVGDRIVIFNPGTAPDPALEQPGPDIAVVAEESYAAFCSLELQKRLTTLQHDRTRYAYIVHSVPSERIPDLVLELMNRGKYIFISDLADNVYCRFGPSFCDFIRAIDAAYR